MPTVMKQGGFAVMIYTNDHPPMHVHVFKAEGEVIITLGDENTPPSVRENLNMRASLERRALEIVADNQDFLIAEWRRIHG